MTSGNNHPELLRLLPQRPPFVMIDALLQADAAAIRSSFTIPEGHLLTENGCFSEAGLVENMAQTAAAGAGYQAQQEGRPVPMGFIGALKDLKVWQLPPVGATITTETRVLHQVLQASIVQAVVRMGEKEIASCELKIFTQ